MLAASRNAGTRPLHGARLDALPVSKGEEAEQSTEEAQSFTKEATRHSYPGQEADRPRQEDRYSRAKGTKGLKNYFLSRAQRTRWSLISDPATSKAM